MSAVTHVRFYPSDWLAGTRGMSAAETGVYITLIAMMYERCGPVDATDTAKLARLCGTSASAMKVILDRLIADGKLKLSDGVLTNSEGSFLSIQRRVSPIGWQETRLRIFARDGFACVYCGDQTEKLECDHIFPASKGGADDDDNLATACRSCNASKGAKLLMEWAQ